MGASEPTPEEVGHSLAVFGNYRVLRTQQQVKLTAEQHGWAPHASVMMALGLRETGLTNECGGAVLKNGVWVASFTDRGCFQISDQIEENRKWLASVIGCPNHMWSPQVGHSAAEPMYVPRFTDALLYTLNEFRNNHAGALQNGVPVEDAERFCVAAHNAGFSGALDGFHRGNVDLHTAHGDYSAWVKKYAGVVHDWVLAHPAWVYTNQPL